LSNTGYAPTGISQTSYGAIKANPQGNKIGIAFYGYASDITTGCRVEVADFNNSTGQVSNALNLGTVIGAYGIEFSTSGEMLYASTNPGFIYQWNLCAGSNAAIIGSKYLVANSGPFYGTLQMGPDNKIYTNRNSNFLSTINNPNTYGGGCGFALNNIALPVNGKLGLPNFFSYYLRFDPSFTYVASGCGFVQLSAVIDPATCTSPVSCSWLWTYPGGTATGSPVTVFVGNGIHAIQLTRQCQCYQNSISQDVTVNGGLQAQMVLN